jgi:hypothetical protein
MISICVIYVVGTLIIEILGHLKKYFRLGFIVVKTIQKDKYKFCYLALTRALQSCFLN